MSAYSNNTSSSSNRLDSAPGERPLYFNNRGLFSDPFLAYHLPDLEKIQQSDAASKYLNKYWNEPVYEGYDQFNLAYAQMISMWDQYAELLPEYNEAQLEERWIKPILKLLGWTYEVQDGTTKRAKRNVPDYSLFQSEQEYIKAKKTKTDEAYFAHVLAVADAKAWKIPLDGTGRTNNNPSYQISRYMEHAGVQWGILTNGRFWRLYSMRSTSKHTTYYEIDLEALLVKRDDSRFKYFYNFFRRDAFVKSAISDQCFLDVTFENGVYYAKEVEGNLKQRVFEAVESIARGFSASGKKHSEERLREIYEHSLYYLFRLMFILNCESKGLLAVDKTSDYYEHSLRKLITDLKSQYDTNQNWSNQSRTYGLIASLFDLLSSGDSRIGVYGFGEEVFASGNLAFYQQNKIADHYLNTALIQLSCDYSDDGDELQFIDYKRLSEDHLGSLFEGLLEYELKYAEKKMVVTKTGKVEEWSELSDKQKKAFSAAAIESGALYLSSGSGERKVTGSYYTPHYVVDQIVRSSLDSMCLEKSPEKILKVRVCDPAMGSGHFLLGTVKYLEERIQEYIFKNETDIAFDMEATRWQILANCIFGVDVNPLAVELSKFSLWMYTARRGYKLENLGDQFKCADSLTSDYGSKALYADVLKDGGFDAVIGNPPYLTLKGKEDADQDDSYLDRMQEEYGEVYEYKGNLYNLFIAKALRFVRSGGVVSYIVPTTLAQNKYFGKTRAFLNKHSNIQSFKRFNFNVFAAGTGDTLVFVLRAKESQSKFVEIFEYDSEDKVGVSPSFKLEASKVFGEDRWYVLPQGEYALLDEMNSARKISEYFEVKNGINTGNMAEFLISESNKGPLYKKLLEGKDVLPYRTSWNGLWVNYDPDLDQKIPLSKIKGRQKRHDYALRSPGIFDVPKLIIRQTGDRPIAAFDSKKFYSRHSTHLILSKNGDIDDLKVLCCLLNSEAYAKIYDVLVNEKGKLFAEVKAVHVLNLPFPDFSNRDRKALINLFDKIYESGPEKAEVPLSAVEQIIQMYFPSVSKIIKVQKSA